VLVVRDRGFRRETKLLQILIFVKSTLWKVTIFPKSQITGDIHRTLVLLFIMLRYKVPLLSCIPFSMSSEVMQLFFWTSQAVLMAMSILMTLLPRIGLSVKRWLKVKVKLKLK